MIWVNIYTDIKTDAAIPAFAGVAASAVLDAYVDISPMQFDETTSVSSTSASLLQNSG